MKVTVRVRGVADVRRALLKLGDDAEKALDAAVVAGALVVENAAKVKAPKLSGTLARSITHERDA